MENNNIQNSNFEQQNEQQEQSISLRSIWKFFTGNWFWFLISVVLCLGLGFLYCKISPKVYSSSATIYIDENASRSVKSDVTTMTNLRMMRQTSVVDNEATILRSRSLMQKVVENLNLNIVYKAQAKLRKVEVYAPAVPAHVVIDSLMRGFAMELKLAENSASGIIKYSVLGEEYEKKFSTEYDTPVYSEVGIFRIVKNQRFVEDYAKVIRKNNEFFVSVTSPERAARALTASLSVAPTSKTTSIISVGMKSAVPQKSADIVNELIYVYNEDAKEGERAVARATMEFVDERLAIVGSDLEEVDQNVENYRKKANTLNSQSEANIYVQTAARLEEEAVELETQIRILKDVQASIEKVAGQVELVPNLGIEDATRNSHITNYNNAVLEYKTLGGDAKLSNPQVSNLRERILSIQSILPASIKNIQSSLEVKLRSVNRQIADNQAKVK
ncbi:MAG: hypothetical protein J6R74_02300, partial [Tidjanibacter sp.]|nr:hypothetical protein [Tidjanibacter sp.]